MGFGKANNIGMKASKGRYVCLVNSDIEVLPGCFGNMIGFMDNNETIGMLGPRTLFKDLSIQPSCRNFASLRNNLNMALGLARDFLIIY